LRLGLAKSITASHEIVKYSHETILASSNDILIVRGHNKINALLFADLGFFSYYIQLVIGTYLRIDPQVLEFRSLSEYKQVFAIRSKLNFKNGIAN
jgi:hypothetical protein